MEKWYKKSFYRNLVDMHIPDSDPSYLSKFDSEEYARIVASSGVDTAILYTSNCLGKTFFDAEQKHRCIGDRDLVQERIEAFKKYGVRTILYFNIWNREAALTHPDWEQVNAIKRPRERFRKCCLCSEGYRDFVKRQLENLSTRYEFEGIWIDMIDWFDVLCVCPTCRARLRAEYGVEMPETVDYADESFAKYRLAREKWLCEFMDIVEGAIKKHRPEATVIFQNAAWVRGVETGISEESAQKTEFLAGDFYGLPLAYSVICKLLNNASKNRPVEFMTSLCADLTSHTASKTDKELLRSIQGSLAHNTAFTFIDAIDPVGTINESRYARMRRLGEQTKRERENLCPDARLISDVAYYVNYDSLFEYCRIPMAEHAFHDAITEKMKNFAEAMIERHISYDVQVRKNLQATQSSVLFLSDQRILTESETAALTEFVKNGGTLIATRMTGTLTKEGKRLPDFELSSLLGVHYEGESEYNCTYLRRKDASVKEFIDYDEGYPVAVNGSATLIRAENDTEILAYITLPISSSSDSESFSSAISDPPIVDTEYPAITRKRLGKGQAVYIAAPLEESRHFEGRRLLSELILTGCDRKVTAEAPEWLEVIVYHDEENRRYLVNCLNTMPGYDAIAQNVNIHLQTYNEIQSVYNITASSSVLFSQESGTVSITLPVVDGFAMTELKY